MFFKVLSILGANFALWALIAMIWFPIWGLVVLLVCLCVFIGAYTEIVQQERYDNRIRIIKRADFAGK